MDDDDQELVRRAIAGDRQALAQLLRSCEPELRTHVAVRFTQRWQALLSVDDVLQDTYTDAFLAVSSARFQTVRDFGAWLKRIAAHNLDNVIRLLEADKRGGGRQPLSCDPLDSSDTLVAHLAAVDSGTPSRLLSRQETRELLRRALEALPADHRRVVMLYDLEGRAIAARTVTYDFHRLLEAEGITARKVRCSEFGQCVIESM